MLHYLHDNSNAAEFRKPVDYIGLNFITKAYIIGYGLTDYTSIIKNPMDLETVMRRLKEE